MGVRAIKAILGDVWAIREEALAGILEIANREHEFAGKIDALEQKLGRELNNTHTVTVRDGVAIVPVTGPLFRYANVFTAISGATSYETLALDLRTAVDDPLVHSILLQIDSPGGAANGVNELAKQVRDAAKTHRVVAYVGGQAASAAYWIAAAADEIVADDVAVIGSIGAMINVEEDEEGSTGKKRKYRFTSSVSPMKNAPASTEAGAAEIQRLANELGQAFVDAVASYRGIDSEEVLEKYGKGAVYIGAEAMKRGMIDRVSTFETVLKELSTTTGRPGANGAFKMSKENQNTELTAAQVAEKYPAAAKALREEGAAAAAESNKTAVDAARAEGAKAERERITEIEALAVPGSEELVAKLKADASMTPANAAMAILKAQKDGTIKPADATAAAAAAAGKQHLANLGKTEATIDPPKTGADTEPTEAELAKSIVGDAKKTGVI